MGTDVTLQTKLCQGQELYLGTRQRERTPPFWKIGGNMSYNRSKFPSFGNLTEVMKEISKGAHWLLWSLLERRDDKTNICVLTPKNSAETARVARAYKELHKAKLVKRIRRSHYIINPAAFQPRTENYEEVFLKWESV